MQPNAALILERTLPRAHHREPAPHLQQLLAAPIHFASREAERGRLRDAHGEPLPPLRLAQRSPSHHNHFHLFTWRAGGQGPPGVHDDGPPARQQGLRHAPGRALLLPHPTPPTPTIPSPTPADARSISAARRITTGATPATTRPRPATTRAPGASRTCGRTSSQARRSSMRSTSERSTRPAASGNIVTTAVSEPDRCHRQFGELLQ